ncbi:MAG: hypothetical protein V2A72_04875 [Candidatus Omnitrophota bacterium]
MKTQMAICITIVIILAIPQQGECLRPLSSRIYDKGFSNNSVLVIKSQDDSEIPQHFLEMRDLYSFFHEQNRSCQVREKSVNTQNRIKFFKTCIKSNDQPGLKQFSSFKDVVYTDDGFSIYLIDYYAGVVGGLGDLSESEVLSTDRCVDCAGAAFGAEKKGILHVYPKRVEAFPYVSQYIRKVPKETTALIAVRKKEFFNDTFKWLQEEFRKKGIVIMWVIVPDAKLQTVSNTFKDIMVSKEGVYISVYIDNFNTSVAAVSVDFCLQQYFTWESIRQLLSKGYGAILLSPGEENNVLNNLSKTEVEKKLIGNTKSEKNTKPKNIDSEMKKQAKHYTAFDLSA